MHRCNRPAEPEGQMHPSPRASSSCSLLFFALRLHQLVNDRARRLASGLWHTHQFLLSLSRHTFTIKLPQIIFAALVKLFRNGLRVFIWCAAPTQHHGFDGAPISAGSTGDNEKILVAVARVPNGSVGVVGDVL